MATKKITQLPTASVVLPTDLVPIVDLGDTMTQKATWAQVAQGLDGIVATLSGSKFNGPVTASLGVSGSHGSFGTANVALAGTIRLPHNATFKVRDSTNVADIGVFDAQNGAFIWGEATNVSYQAYRAFSGGYHFFQLGGVDKFTVSGSGVTAYVPYVANAGFSGSLTRLVNGTSYLVAGANTTIVTQSNGSVLITATGGSAAAGGNFEEIQFNNSAALGGIVGSSYNGVRIYFPQSLTASAGLSGSHGSFGTANVASTGSIRLARISSIKGRNNANNGDISFAETDSNDYLYIGSNAALSGDRAGIVYVVPSTRVYLGSNGSAAAQVDSTNGLTMLSSYPINIGTGYLAAGTNPADTGVVRLPNNNGIFARNAANTANLQLAYATNLNEAIYGGGGVVNMYFQANNGFDWQSGSLYMASLNPFGYQVHGGVLVLSATATAATVGSIRMQPNTYVRARTTQNDANLYLVGSDSANQVYLGSVSNPSGTWVASGFFNAYLAESHFFQNSSGVQIADLSTGASQFFSPVQIGSAGAPVASQGRIRLANGAASGVFVRNAANSDDITAFFVDNSNVLWMGGGAGSTMAQTTIVGANNDIAIRPGGGTTNYLYMTSTRSDFSHPVRATSVSASYYELNGSGNTKPTSGAIRIPYNNGTTDKIIVALNNVGSDVNFLVYGGGHAWTMGSTNHSFNLDTYSYQTVALNGPSSHYHNGGYNIYSYGRSAYDIQITNTGMLLNTLPGRRAADLTTVGHRLSIMSGTSVVTGSVISGSTLYLTPHASTQISLFDGTDWWQYQTGQVSVALSGLTLDRNYDVFAYINTGAVAIELGAAWTNSTTRSTALTTQDGVLVKSGDNTRRYLGTIRSTSTTTTEDSNEKRFVWNQYNKVRRKMYKHDPTNTWSYVGSYRPANNNVNNSIQYVCGDNATDLEVFVQGMVNYTATGWGAAVDVGLDSSATGSAQIRGGSYTIANAHSWPYAQYQGTPAAGHHILYWVEFAGNTVNWYGDNGDMAYFTLGIRGNLFG